MKDGNKDSLNIQLATMPLPDAPFARPSVRTVVYRGFAGQPRKPDGEPTGGNPISGVTSDLIIVSSDIRMLKTRQLLAQQEEAKEGNGFEVCWWHQGTQEQFRLAGRAWVYSSNATDNASFPSTRLQKLINIPTSSPSSEDSDSGVGRNGNGTKTEGDGPAQWTWEGERRRQFAKHSPHLRASFRAPEPGSNLTSEKAEKVKTLPVVPASHEDADDAAGRALVDEAMDTFSLVVLEMQEVEYLKVDPPPVRTRWTLQSDGAWSTQEVSP